MMRAGSLCLLAAVPVSLAVSLAACAPSPRPVAVPEDRPGFLSHTPALEAVYLPRRVGVRRAGVGRVGVGGPEASGGAVEGGGGVEAGFGTSGTAALGADSEAGVASDRRPRRPR